MYLHKNSINSVICSLNGNAIRQTSLHLNSQLILLLLPCMLQVMIVLEFLHKGDLRKFLCSLTPEYVMYLTVFVSTACVCTVQHHNWMVTTS